MRRKPRRDAKVNRLDRLYTFHDIIDKRERESEQKTSTKIVPAVENVKNT